MCGGWHGWNYVRELEATCAARVAADHGGVLMDVIATKMMVKGAPRTIHYSATYFMRVLQWRFVNGWS
ncbi:hypothetical protein M404DRAFT_1005260 [Pisolithus tinctorius Marx 270]|uniref:Uncharacterized protein n=1 Tax=Pisolithus tinctorius Marx 270 TaxID=870435 RepID=A0A0C3NSU0_PISTI|nr:hypothetical protein M404DRAFT_1005260 [Pisolithus tinctorius Marx 270]